MGLELEPAPFAMAIQAEISESLRYGGLKFELMFDD